MDTATDYDRQATEFLREYGFDITIEGGQGECPPWADGKGGKCPRGECGSTHGGDYIVTISRPGECKIGHPPFERCDHQKELSFPFWGSLADYREAKDPSWYDVLSCLSSDASYSTSPDEVAEEFGPMKPSQALRIADFAWRLQHFFSKAELEALSEIQ